MSENTEPNPVVIEPKPILKSKTMILNSLLFIVALVGLVQDSVQIPVAAMPYLLLVVAVCNLALRYFFTDSAVKVK